MSTERGEGGTGRSPGGAPALACTLGPDEMRARRDELLPGLVEEAVTTESLDGGVRWRFDGGRTSVTRIASVIERERSCCGFLRFRVEVEPGRGAIILEVTGPEGTREMLDGLLGETGDMWAP